MPTAQQALTIPSRAADLALQSRAAARRSSAFFLVSKNPMSDEIHDQVKRSLTDTAIREISLAHDGVSTELALPGKVDGAQIIGELTRAIALLGGGWPSDQREEWIGVMTDELRDLPHILTIPAIREARRTVRFAKDFLPAVIESITEPLSKLRAEKDTLETLLEIAHSETRA